MKKENLVGKRFGKLVVIKELPPKDKKNKRPSWQCLCDCGNIVEIYRGCNLKSGGTVSCGCHKNALAAIRLSEIAFNNRVYEPKTASAREVFLRKYSDGNLVFDDFYRLSQLNCFYCVAKPSNKKDTVRHDRSGFFSDNCTFVYSGLDRVDNNLPHNLNNCVPCCKECNMSKRNMKLNDFYRMIYNVSFSANKPIPNYIEQFSISPSIDLSRFKGVKRRMTAIYTDIDFTTFDYNLFSFIISQNCFYCDRKPCNTPRNKKNNIILCNGLDRIDQKLPHTIDNIIPCCKYCNWSKAKRSYAEFLSWAIRAHNHLLNNRNYLAANNLQSAV